TLVRRAPLRLQHRHPRPQLLHLRAQGLQLRLGHEVEALARLAGRALRAVERVAHDLPGPVGREVAALAGLLDRLLERLLEGREDPDPLADAVRDLVLRAPPAFVRHRSPPGWGAPDVRPRGACRSPSVRRARPAVSPRTAP